MEKCPYLKGVEATKSTHGFLLHIKSHHYQVCKIKKAGYAKSISDKSVLGETSKICSLKNQFSIQLENLKIQALLREQTQN